MELDEVTKKGCAYVSDFPLKTTGGATAAKIQKAMWSCNNRG